MNKIAKVEIIKRKPKHTCNYCKGKPPIVLEYANYKKSYYFCNESCFSNYNRFSIVPVSKKDVSACELCKENVAHYQPKAITFETPSINPNPIPKEYFEKLSNNDILELFHKTHDNDRYATHETEYKGLKIIVRVSWYSFVCLPCHDKYSSKVYHKTKSIYPKKMIAMLTGEVFTIACAFCEKRKPTSTSLVVRNGKYIRKFVCSEECGNLLILGNQA